MSDKDFARLLQLLAKLYRWRNSGSAYLKTPLYGAVKIFIALLAREFEGVELVDASDIPF